MTDPNSDSDYENYNDSEYNIDSDSDLEEKLEL